MVFIKKVNGRIEKAPLNLVTQEGRTIINYSSLANKKQLLEDGYLQYFGNNLLEYVDIVDGKIVELQYPPVSEIRESLINELYELKSSVAYTGIILRDETGDYLFETNSTSITLINSTLVSANDDSMEIKWKCYKDGEVAFYTITIGKLKELFGFGMTVINTAFGTESAFVDQVENMTEEQFANKEFVEEFRTNARTAFDSINKVFVMNEIINNEEDALNNSSDVQVDTDEEGNN